MKRKSTLLILIGLLIVALIGAYFMNRPVKFQVSSDEDKQASQLTVIGRASVKLTLADGKVVYIDPYAGSLTDYSDPADLVLVTHDDSDHNATELITLKEDGNIISVHDDILPGEQITEKGILITAVDAYNSNHSQGMGVGYILEFDGITLYHSGDTSYFEEMSALKSKEIDYALLCMDGYYNMGPEEAMAVADAIAPKHVIPIHTHRSEDYNEDNVLAFTSPLKLEVKPGETILLMPAN